MADQVLGAHRAGVGILHQPVRRTVDRVAARGDFLVDVDQQRLRQIRRGRGQRRLLHHEAQHPRVVVHVGIAGDDAVVVGGIALGLHHRHPPAGRAPVEIRVLHRLRVIRPRECLAGHGDVVFRAIKEVGDLDRVTLAVRAKHPVRVRAVAGMPGVGDDADIALAQSQGLVGRVDRRHQTPGIAADTHGEKPLPPCIR